MMDEYAKVRKKCERARIRSGESREGFTAEKWRSEEATSATKARSLSLCDNECDRIARISAGAQSSSKMAGKLIVFVNRGVDEALICFLNTKQTYQRNLATLPDSLKSAKSV